MLLNNQWVKGEIKRKNTFKKIIEGKIRKIISETEAKKTIDKIN